jgi:peroxiredoxin Q/BCP
MHPDGLIAVGDPAPAFALPASDGRTYALADELGRHHVALFFYPGNDTPG